MPAPACRPSARSKARACHPYVISHVNDAVGRAGVRLPARYRAVRLVLVAVDGVIAAWLGISEAQPSKCWCRYREQAWVGPTDAPLLGVVPRVSGYP